MEYILTLFIFVTLIVVVIMGIKKVTDFFDTAKTMIDYAKQSEIEASESAKSVSGMTSLLLPQIQRDYPKLDYKKLAAKAENMLMSSFQAVERQNSSILTDATKDLKQQIELHINSLKAQGRIECFRDVKISDFAIHNYIKGSSFKSSVITLQCAVGYYHFIKENDKIISGRDDLKKQTKYNINALYVLDTTAAQETGQNCPNCGAPVSEFGKEFCPYCKSALLTDTFEWIFGSFEEVTAKVL